MNALDPEDFNQGLEMIFICVVVAMAAWLMLEVL